MRALSSWLSGSAISLAYAALLLLAAHVGGAEFCIIGNEVLYSTCQSQQPQFQPQCVSEHQSLQAAVTRLTSEIPASNSCPHIYQVFTTHPGNACNQDAIARSFSIYPMIWTDSNEGGCLGPDGRYPALLCAYLGQPATVQFGLPPSFASLPMGSRTNYSALMQVVDPSSMAVINFTVPLNMYIHLDFTIPTTWKPGPYTLRTVVRHVNGTVAWENSRNPFEILPTRTPIAGALSCSLPEPALIWFHGFRSVTPAVQITIVTFHTKASSFQTCNRTEFEVASEFQVAASATIVNGSGLFRSDPNNHTLHPHVRMLPAATALEVDPETGIPTGSSYFHCVMVTGIDGEFAGFKTSISILLVSSLAVTSNTQITPQATEAVVSDSQPEQPKVAVIHLPVPAPGLHDLDHIIEVLGGLSIVLSVLAGGGFSAIRQVQFYAILQFLTCSTHDLDDESPEPLLWTNLLLEEAPVRHDSYLIELFIGNLFCIGVMLVSLWILRTIAFVLRRTLPQNDTSNCIAQRAHFLEYPRGELMVLEFSLPGLCMSSGWALTSSQSLFVVMGATCLVLTFVPFVVPLGIFALREQLLQFLRWTPTLPRELPQTTTCLRAQYQKLERWRYKGTWEEQTRPASLTWKFSRPIILGYRELPSLVIWAMFLLFHLRQFGTGLVAGLAVGPNAAIRASTALWVLCGLHGIEVSILLLSGLLSAEVSGLPFRDKIVDIMEITAGIGRLILLVLAMYCREGSTEIITAMRTANASVTAGLSLLEILSAACGAAGMMLEQDEHRNETERTRTDDNPNLEDSAQDASQDDTAQAHLGFEGVSDGSTPSFHNGNEDNWGNFAPNATTPQAQQLPSMPVPPDLQPQLGTQHDPYGQHDPYARPDWVSTGPDMSNGRDNTPPHTVPRNTVPIPLQNFSDRRQAAHGNPVRRVGLDG